MMIQYAMIPNTYNTTAVTLADRRKRESNLMNLDVMNLAFYINEITF